MRLPVNYFGYHHPKYTPSPAQRLHVWSQAITALPNLNEDSLELRHRNNVDWLTVSKVMKSGENTQK